MKLEYCPVDLITGYERVVRNGKLIVPFEANWLTLPSLSLANRDYEISKTDSKQGAVYTCSVNGFLTGLTAENLNAIDEMQSGKFAVKITVANAVLMMATPEHGAEFIFKASGGGQGSDFSKISFQFQSKMPHAIYKL